MTRIATYLKDITTPSAAAWRRRATAGLCGLAFLAATLSLAACSSPSGNAPGSASHSGVQFYGTVDTGVGYEKVSN